MDNEFNDIVQKEIFEKVEISGDDILLWKKTVDDKNIYIAKTGVGPVSAAYYLSQLVKLINFNEIILLGLGGGVDAQLDPGDIIVGSSIVQHDAICSFDDRIEFMACGELHLSIQPEHRKDIYIPTTAMLNQKYSTYLKNNMFNVFSGTIASGSEFVGSKSRKLNLKSKLNELMLIDMEACSVAYICERKKIPFTVIKTVADSIKNNSVNEYKDFINSNKRKCAEVYQCIVLS
jgi:5'-methylthioadenosine/S-adenosylhomocysteine nucleosidase